jgi:hypothetical protein
MPLVKIFTAAPLKASAATLHKAFVSVSNEQKMKW